MKQHPSVSKVQENGCGALRNLALYAENQTAIRAGGGIEAVVAAIVYDSFCPPVVCLLIVYENFLDYC